MRDEERGPRIEVRGQDAVDPNERLRTRLTVAVCLLSSARMHIAQTEHLSAESRARILRHLDEAADVLVELPREPRGGNGHPHPRS